jgi:uncharacterized membrane protein YdjX (TVP38/TMEM64 family)
MKINKTRLFWGALITLLLLLILIPFAAFGEPMEAWMEQRMQQFQEQPLLAFLMVMGSLGSDVVLPVPSSIVSTLGGAALGTILGTLASWLGMMVSCILGYWLGRSGRPLGKRMVGANEMQRLDNLEKRIGDWAIVAVRAVPVLAEASTILAGIGHMPLRRFVYLSALANLGVSFVYSFIGSISGRADAFLPAFGISLLLAGVAMLAGKRFLPEQNWKRKPNK